MGKLMDKISAAASEGNRVNGLVHVTSVDTIMGAREVIQVFRWVHYKYLDEFTSMNECGVRPDPTYADFLEQAYYDYTAEMKRECTDVVKMTIMEAVRWTVIHICDGVKKPVFLAYASAPGSLTAEEEIDALTGKSWNTMIIADGSVGDIYNVVQRAGITPLNILNKSLEDYEVLLTTTKGR